MIHDNLAYYVTRVDRKASTSFFNLRGSLQAIKSTYKSIISDSSCVLLLRSFIPLLILFPSFRIDELSPRLGYQPLPQSIPEIRLDAPSLDATLNVSPSSTRPPSIASSASEGSLRDRVHRSLLPFIRDKLRSGKTKWLDGKSVLAGPISDEPESLDSAEGFDHLEPLPYNNGHASTSARRVVRRKGHIYPAPEVQ